MNPPSLVIEAPARLHFGMLDLRGDLGRRYGGIGAAVRAPSLRIEASASPTLEVVGEDAGRARAIADQVRAQLRLTSGARLVVQRALPPHAGLGSGTQLALAVARAIVALDGRHDTAESLAALTGRGRRSAVGTWTFALGGFVLEGGRRRDDDRLAPLLARYDMPDEWRCVLAIPPADADMTGDREARAFASLPLSARESVERVAHLVLMALLPALVARDLEAFGRAVSEVQRITGAWFAHAQGGPFAPGLTSALVEALDASGASGVGQSSWGPTVYAFADGDRQAEALVRRASEVLAGAGTVMVTTFDNEGARLTWNAPSGTTHANEE
jgi:beta-RFAP synthase